MCRPVCLLVVVAFTVGAPWSSAQANLAEMSESARTYLTGVLDKMEKGALNRDSIDWKRVRAETFALAGSAQTTADTYVPIAHAIGELKERHSFLMLPDSLDKDRKLAIQSQMWAELAKSEACRERLGDDRRLRRARCRDISTGGTASSLHTSWCRPRDISPVVEPADGLELSVGRHELETNGWSWSETLQRLNDLLPRVSPRTDHGIHQVKQNHNGRSGRVAQRLERRNGLFAAIFEKLESRSRATRPRPRQPPRAKRRSTMRRRRIERSVSLPAVGVTWQPCHSSPRRLACNI
jgi:hypothetical protein